MTGKEMAKIYAPYAALKGFGDYIRAAEHETAERRILGEDAAAELNRQLQSVGIGDIIAVTYYLVDNYAEAFGKVKKIDLDERVIQIGGMRIPIEDILSVNLG